MTKQYLCPAASADYNTTLPQDHGPKRILCRNLTVQSRIQQYEDNQLGPEPHLHPPYHALLLPKLNHFFLQLFRLVIGPITAITATTALLLFVDIFVFGQWLLCITA